jgi:hypothetical protein
MSFSWLQGTPSIHWILHHTATEQIPIMSFNSVEITLEGLDHSSLNITTKDDWTELFRRISRISRLGKFTL